MCVCVCMILCTTCSSLIFCKNISTIYFLQQLLSDKPSSCPVPSLWITCSQTSVSCPTESLRSGRPNLVSEGLEWGSFCVTPASSLSSSELFLSDAGSQTALHLCQPLGLHCARISTPNSKLDDPSWGAAAPLVEQLSTKDKTQVSLEKRSSVTFNLNETSSVESVRTGVHVSNQSQLTLG